ncbi:MAG: hypothetical protein WC353_03830 [Candidatus Peribacter sp.]|jgi:hypothetical protein
MKNQMTWDNFLAKADEKTQQAMRPMIEMLFEPDGISPLAFLVNHQFLLSQGREWLSEIGKEKYRELQQSRTPTIEKFQSNLDRPLAFSNWFMAAYPDVAYWLSQNAEEVLKEKEIIGVDVDSPDAATMLYDEEKKIRPEIVRRIVDHYLTHVAPALECALQDD